ncbi:MAG: phosphate ABC transporter permease subunit PstC [Spirochaetia bacterium]|jgi:phosphate transport system permease protein|nr:phosphate ABC transporter permease subunit PstC [Spirochaetia bacterium]
MNRKYADRFFQYFFRMVSLVSVLALGAILIFVFAQGLMPFVGATAPGIRLVVQNIGELAVNGRVYRNVPDSISLEEDARFISLRFPSGDAGEEVVDIEVNADERDARKRLVFARNPSAKVSYPEAYVVTLGWPGLMAGRDRKIHIILPEPPYSPVEFIGGMQWQPVRDKVFGVFPMIAGTVLASLGAIFLGVPVALLCALFMAEFLADRPAAFARGAIELLAGIPSVVYGFFGLMVIVPAVKNVFGIAAGNTLLSAVVVLALMILPTVITIAESSMRAVSLSLKEASLSLGASKMQTAWHITLFHAHSGVIAGIILGISRAVGETMAVILVAGNSPQLVFSPLESVRTLTATIAMEMGYASGRHSEMLFSIGVVLFIMILALNSLILRLRRGMDVV